jgi:hypothetical protein
MKSADWLRASNSKSNERSVRPQLRSLRNTRVAEGRCDNQALSAIMSLHADDENTQRMLRFTLPTCYSAINVED